MASATTPKQGEAILREIALAYPESHEEFPWGERAIKVKGKVFVFLWADDKELSVSLKLPISNEMALMFPFAEPTRYGLGKSGWVSSKFGAREDVPIEILREWIDESYRAVAPKKLVAGLPALAAKPSAAPAPQKAKAQTPKPGTAASLALKRTKAGASKPPASSKPAKAKAEAPKPRAKHSTRST